MIGCDMLVADTMQAMLKSGADDGRGDDGESGARGADATRGRGN